MPVNKQNVMKQALRDYIISSLMADNTIDIRTTMSSTIGWTDRGSGAELDLSSRLVNPDSGYFRVGDSTSFYNSWPTVKELTPSTEVYSIASALSSPLFQFPTDYPFDWDDRASGAYADGSFWTPVCPLNYRALGSRIVIGYSKPATDWLYCVHDRCVIQCSIGPLLWNDVGSDANKDGSIFGVSEVPGGMAMNTGVSFSGYDPAPYSGKFYCLKRKCVGPPLNVSKTILAIEEYFSVVPDTAIALTTSPLTTAALTTLELTPNEVTSSFLKIDSASTESVAVVSTGPKQSGGSVARIIIGVIAGILIAAIIVGVILFAKRQRKKKYENDIEMSPHVPLNSAPPVLKNIQIQEKIGNGNFGEGIANCNELFLK